MNFASVRNLTFRAPSLCPGGFVPGPQLFYMLLHSKIVFFFGTQSELDLQFSGGSTYDGGSPGPKQQEPAMVMAPTGERCLARGGMIPPVFSSAFCFRAFEVNLFGRLSYLWPVTAIRLRYLCGRPNAAVPRAQIPTTGPLTNRSPNNALQRCWLLLPSRARSVMVSTAVRLVDFVYLRARRLSYVGRHGRGSAVSAGAAIHKSRQDTQQEIW